VLGTVLGMAPHSSSLARVDRLLHVLGPGPWPVADLLAAGWTRGQLQRAVATGLLARPRRGMYTAPETGRAQLSLAVGSAGAPLGAAEATSAAVTARPSSVHRSRLRALAQRLPSSAVFSHASAGRELGLWLPYPADPVAHVTIPGQADREAAGLHVHGSGLPTRFVMHGEGFLLTDIRRTAVDLARPCDLPHALIPIDSALRLMLEADYSDLDRHLRRREVPYDAVERARGRFDEVLDAMTGWPGMRTARAAVAAADPASASPYESWSRGWMLAVGLPPPELNVVLRGASGREYVVDFLWRDRGLIGEADGMSKYGRTAEEIRRTMRAEKERQADLEAAGWRFARWVVGDSGATIVARVGRALYLPPSSRDAALRRGA